MGVTLGAVVSAIAVALPLIDTALKDYNYKKARKLQDQINNLAAKYSLSQAQLNALLSKYSNKYSEAVSYLSSTTRGSVDSDKALENYKDTRNKIKTITNELSDNTSKFEKANSLLNNEKAKVESKGLVQTITELGGIK